MLKNIVMLRYGHHDAYGKMSFPTDLLELQRMQFLVEWFHLELHHSFLLKRSHFLAALLDAKFPY